MKLRDYLPALKFGAKIYPEDLATGNPWANYWYVDADNGSDSANNGKSVDKATATVGQAITNAARGDVIFVRAKAMSTGATDPASYEENIVIPADKDMLSITGIGTGRTQGGLPQFKDGTGTTTAILIVRAPGCSIANIGFNGAGNTGGNILLDDDGSTKTAFGTTIDNCHFKNAKSSGAASTGGAIAWAATGNAWQVRIKDSLFYNCRAGIVVKNTTGSVPQDVVIENCDFTSSVNTNVDADIYIPDANGIIGLMVKKCNFGTVDVPAYATSQDAARYIKVGSATKGSIIDCNFACISQGTSAKTFGASGDAVIVPTTVRMAGCHGEAASDATGDAGDVFRT